MGVLGSGSNDLGSGVGGEGSGSGGLGYLETELLIGLDSLKKESREKGDFGPYCLKGVAMDFEGEGGKDFGPIEVGL